jgi:hypothetical protein
MRRTQWFASPRRHSRALSYPHSMLIMDSEGKEFRMLNQNVLIEIGAAMALYGAK